MTRTAPVPGTAEFPLLADLAATRPVTWWNPGLRPTAVAMPGVGLGIADVDDAADRLRRFAPLLAQVFPDTRGSGGIVESPLRAAPALQRVLGERAGTPFPGELWVKLDSHLPVSGSIKARGGLYEVLKLAEELAVQAGLLTLDDDYRRLLEAPVRDLFARRTIVVGSTGNLGLSIGIAGAALGFRVTVHMSADARRWKKDRLREHGVTVVEHDQDYSAAVAAGRAAVAQDPSAHFVDDENSTDLFLGYAVAARRLAGQLQALDVRVDVEHPLVVHLPCGVGGGPGGIAFGLKTIFADAVHCVFAEPTHSPCMLLGVGTGRHDGISVQDLGIDNVTVADGLAVGRASGFVGRRMGALLSAFCTVSDEELLRTVALLHETEGLGVEPSAVAGIPGALRLLTATASEERAGLGDDRLRAATHVAWLTGGSMVPAEELAAYVDAGRALL
ncbi:D-serine ammonia-lyase [Kineococcus gynurae]|uniref:Probable D-serine dehydratase n=1 Tax=Kineococcus gynurae TaxID=452979 RepID=A0ABV5LUB9_9ACTN